MVGAMATRRAFLQQVLKHSGSGLSLLTMSGLTGLTGWTGCGPAATRLPPGSRSQAAPRWQRLAQAPTVKGKQDDLFFVDPQRGWSVNGGGNIFHTSDGGATWTQLLHQDGT